MKMDERPSYDAWHDSLIFVPGFIFITWYICKQVAHGAPTSKMWVCVCGVGVGECECECVVVGVCVCVCVFDIT